MHSAPNTSEVPTIETFNKKVFELQQQYSDTTQALLTSKGTQNSTSSSTTEYTQASGSSNKPKLDDMLDTCTAKIQAYNLLSALLIIKADSTIAKFDTLILEYTNKLNNQTKNFTINDAIALKKECVKLLKTQLKLNRTEAEQQLIAARDCALMLQQNKEISTRGKFIGNDTLAENSKLLKISEDYYQRYYYPGNAEFDTNQKWFQAANQKICGKKISQPENTWLAKFFQNHKELIIKNGLSAPPSARWLPLPANVHKHSIVYEYNNPNSSSSSSSNNVNDSVITRQAGTIIRLGTPVCYELPKEIQFDLAVDIYKEIFKTQLNSAIKQYKMLYGDLANEQPFYANHINLLSPNWYDGHGQKDNNTHFVETAKLALAAVQKDYSSNPENYVNKENATIPIYFFHTNDAVNQLNDVRSNTGYFVHGSIINYEIDDEAIHEKLLSTYNSFSTKIKFSDDNDNTKLTEILDFIKNSKNILPKNYMNFLNELDNKKFLSSNNTALPAELNSEIATRLRASVQLRRLQNGDPTFSQLPSYQRSIMRAALAQLAQGQQSLNAVGCKSNRDRAAVVIAAVATLLADPLAMSDWNRLNDGIIQNLNRGHHRNAMSYHVALIKLSDVHANFLPAARAADKPLKQFSKATKKKYNLAQKLGLGLVALIGAFTTIAFVFIAVIQKKQKSKTAKNLQELKKSQELSWEDVFDEHDKFEKYDKLSKTDQTSHAIINQQLCVNNDNNKSSSVELTKSNHNNNTAVPQPKEYQQKEPNPSLDQHTQPKVQAGNTSDFEYAASSLRLRGS
ncbi:MAG: hypothetical protein KIT27_04970 [Legionellales bacterium]|nr:hypothetical protein [Legionellales bacterium]